MVCGMKMKANEVTPDTKTKAFYCGDAMVTENRSVSPRVEGVESSASSPVIHISPDNIICSDESRIPNNAVSCTMESAADTIDCIKQSYDRSAGRPAENNSAGDEGGNEVGDDEPVFWQCSVCNVAVFRSYEEALAHENECSCMVETSKSDDGKVGNPDQVKLLSNHEEHNIDEVGSSDLVPSLVQEQLQYNEHVISEQINQQSPLNQQEMEVSEVRDSTVVLNKDACQSTSKPVDEDTGEGASAASMWACDKCLVAEFATYDEAVAHEKVCTGIPVEGSGDHHQQQKQTILPPSPPKQTRKHRMDGVDALIFPPHRIQSLRGCYNQAKKNGWKRGMQYDRSLQFSPIRADDGPSNKRPRTEPDAQQDRTDNTHYYSGYPPTGHHYHYHHHPYPQPPHYTENHDAYENDTNNTHYHNERAPAGPPPPGYYYGFQHPHLPPPPTPMKPYEVVACPREQHYQWYPYHHQAPPPPPYDYSYHVPRPPLPPPHPSYYHHNPPSYNHSIRMLKPASDYECSERIGPAFADDGKSDLPVDDATNQMGTLRYQPETVEERWTLNNDRDKQNEVVPGNMDREKSGAPRHHNNRSRKESKLCSQSGCAEYALSGKSICRKHGNMVVCSHKGCITEARIQGLCSRHWAVQEYLVDEENPGWQLISTKPVLPGGVTQTPSGKWKVMLYYAGKSRYMGLYGLKSDAASAAEISRACRDTFETGGQSTPETVKRNIQQMRKAATALLKTYKKKLNAIPPSLMNPKVATASETVDMTNENKDEVAALPVAFGFWLNEFTPSKLVSQVAGKEWVLNGEKCAKDGGTSELGFVRLDNNNKPVKRKSKKQKRQDLVFPKAPKVAVASEEIKLKIDNWVGFAKLPVAFGFHLDDDGTSKHLAQAATDNWKSRGGKSVNKSNKGLKVPIGNVKMGSTGLPVCHAQKVAKTPSSATPKTPKTPALLLSTEAARKLPDGWISKTFKRMTGKTAGTKDIYFYSPQKQIKFRAMKSCKTFIEILGELAVGGDEAAALKLYKERGHRF